jgi:hypothetical protein
MKKLFLFLVVAVRAPASDSFFSIAQVGDIHAPAFVKSNIAAALAPFIIANTNDGVFNFRGIISAGDVYEQDTNVVYSPPEQGWPVSSMQNAFGLIKSNGLLVVLANGNHDCDAIEAACSYCNGLPSNDSMLWSNIFPRTFFSEQVGFIDTRSITSSHNLVMSYTNGPRKLLFLTYKTLEGDCNPIVDYTDQTQWIIDRAAAYPDHNVFVLAHFFINNERQISYQDSPGLTRLGPGRAPFDQGILGVKNLLFCVAGHDRRLRKRNITMYGGAGQPVDVLAFNTQGHTNNAGVINIFTFYENSAYVRLRTYDITASRFMTNNDVSMLNNLSEGDTHNYILPLAVPTPRRIGWRMQ